MNPATVYTNQLVRHGAERLTHHVVLIANRHMSWRDFQYHLWKCVRRVHECVLRRSSYRGVRTDSLWSFEAFFERSRGGVPHYHLAMRVAPSVCVQILEGIECGWTHRFPTLGSFHRRTVEGCDDQTATIAYITKRFGYGAEGVEAFTTSWHLLPALCKNAQGDNHGDQTDSSRS